MYRYGSILIQYISLQWTTAKCWSSINFQGGTAADYVQHIIESVDQQARMYSDFHKQDYQDSRQSIIDNISNTLTDRVASNHAAIEIVKEAWDKHLNKLNCYFHPLETVASSCRTALKGMEEKREGSCR